MSRALNKLSAAFVRNAPEGKHSDGGGLWLFQRADGGAQWILRVTVHGRRREMGLGSLSFVSLKEAREEAEKWRAVVRAGRDPIKERERERREAAAAHHLGERPPAEVLHDQGWPVPLPGERQHRVRAGLDPSVDHPREVNPQERKARIRHRVDQIAHEVLAFGHQFVPGHAPEHPREARARLVDALDEVPDLIEALEARRGIPVVLNTSLNRRGEPIVCTPYDAYRCFMSTDMDVLVINDGSEDRTGRVAKQTEQALVIDLPDNLGIGGAVQTGFR